MTVYKELKSIRSKNAVPAIAFSAFLLFQSCSGGDPKLKDASEQTVYITTQGVEAIVVEVEPGDAFKIKEEHVLDDKESSRAIVHNLDLSIDTMSMASLKGEGVDPRSSALRSTLMGGLAIAYLTNRSGAITPRSGSYASTSAYNKSNSMASSFKNSATPRKVSIPGKSSKGYGSGKSFRSFGG